MTAESASPTNSGWNVTGQMETQQIGPNGSFVKGIEVYFQTTNGHSGSVFLPNAQYSLPAVTAAIHARADLLDSVGNLSSGS